MDEDFKFEDYSPAEFSAFIGKIRNFDKVDSFLNVIKPNPDVMTTHVDIWNFTRALFIKDTDTTVADLDFVHPLGQPLGLYKKGEIDNSKQYVNLKVNLLLCKMLPASSDEKKELEITALTDLYVRWYIDKVL